jgi:diguanylate cyclase (GGDEF)-like protein/PAS domain S-box-containing protein
MGKSSDVSGSAVLRRRLLLSLLAICLSSAVVAAPAQAPAPAQLQSAQPGGTKGFGLIEWLVGSAVTLGLVAVATALLLARTQAKLDAEKAEKEAIENEFDALYNRAPLGYHTLDLNGAIVEMNDTEVGWLGYRRDEIIGKKYAEFLAEASWTAFSESYRYLLRGERSETTEQRHQIVSKDGKVRSLSLTPFLVRDKKGRIVETRWAAVDISERVRLEQALDNEAHFDRVTNAHNRAFFFTLGEREIARARRAGGHLALLYLDIDDFARINTVYGHFAGDRVLRAVCAVIAQGLRNVDIFARVGDDEFAILLPDVGREGATIVAERLKKAISETPVTLSSNDVVTLNAAIGIGVFSESTQNLDSLLSQGEKDLELAKRAQQAEEQTREEIAEAKVVAPQAETPAA